jgi:Cu(I)-responsive transcriptional regulator
MSARLSIGEAARRSGVAAKNIRYYEQIGLIQAAARASNGYRLYDDRTIALLRFVARARSLGFAIRDVASLLGLWSDATRRSADVRRIAERHLAAIDCKIAELEGLRATLQDLIARCHGDDRPECPILDDLADPPRARPRRRRRT